MVQTTKLDNQIAQSVLDRIVDLNDLIVKMEISLLTVDNSANTKEIMEKTIPLLKAQLILYLSCNK